MAVSDIVLLSKYDDAKLKIIDEEMGASIEKNYSDAVEESLQAMENIMFFAACAEQSSEHPIAKGMSPNFLS